MYVYLYHIGMHAYRPATLLEEALPIRVEIRDKRESLFEIQSGKARVIGQKLPPRTGSRRHERKKPLRRAAFAFDGGMLVT